MYIRLGQSQQKFKKKKTDSWDLRGSEYYAELSFPFHDYTFNYLQFVLAILSLRVGSQSATGLKVSQTFEKVQCMKCIVYIKQICNKR